VSNRARSYVVLWVLALAFGQIEASVVVYLREITARAPFREADITGLQVSLVTLPANLVMVEVVREACTIFLLAAVAWLAGRRLADRAGAFLLSFGVWDLTYYAVLKIVLGWPANLGTWDILFLIPLPWVAPVWAPGTVATIFIAAGSYLFWAPEHPRTYRWPDIGVLTASVLLTIASFLMEWRAAVQHSVPERFPSWLFWAGVVLGTAWFVWVERRATTESGRRASPLVRGV
jgi:hypothetical protein